MIQIDKDVPIPTDGRVGCPRLPVKTIEVGESFVIPDGTMKTPHLIVGRANRCYAPKRFISRRVEGGRRVWRIA